MCTRLFYRCALLHTIGASTQNSGMEAFSWLGIVCPGIPSSPGTGVAGGHDGPRLERARRMVRRTLRRLASI